MFSLIALYFAYRRDVVIAERYVAGLDGTTPVATAPTAAPLATPLLKLAA